jgi:hypothetical protein
LNDPERKVEYGTAEYFLLQRLRSWASRNFSGGLAALPGSLPSPAPQPDLVERLSRAICKVEGLDPDGPPSPDDPNWVRYADAIHQVLLSGPSLPSEPDPTASMMRCTECKQPVCDHVAKRLLPGLPSEGSHKFMPCPRDCGGGDEVIPHKCKFEGLPREETRPHLVSDLVGGLQQNQKPTPEKPLSSACIVNLHDDCPNVPLPLVENGQLSGKTAKCACDCHSAKNLECGAASPAEGPTPDVSPVVAYKNRFGVTAPDCTFGCDEKQYDQRCTIHLPGPKPGPRCPNGESQ